VYFHRQKFALQVEKVSAVGFEKIFALGAQHSQRQVQIFSVAIFQLTGSYLASPLSLI